MTKYEQAAGIIFYFSMPVILAWVSFLVSNKYARFVVVFLTALHCCWYCLIPLLGGFCSEVWGRTAAYESENGHTGQIVEGTREIAKIADGVDGIGKDDLKALILAISRFAEDSCAEGAQSEFYRSVTNIFQRVELQK